MSERELWRPVVGYEGAYEVSDLGRVRSLKSSGRTGAVLIPSKKHYPNQQPRIRTGLTRYGITRKFYISCLVMRAFVGPPPFGMEINHIDGNAMNDKLSNLEYTTRSENQKHAYRLGLRKPIKQLGETNGWSKLDSSKVRNIRAMRAAGLSMGYIAKRYRIAADTVRKIVSGERWSHIAMTTRPPQKGETPSSPSPSEPT